MTKKEREIPKLILNYDYIINFFNSKIKEIDRQAHSVAKLEIWPIKKHIDDVFFHLVVLYSLTFFLQDGSRKRYRVYCCLLYTSPSPRDLSTSRMPSSA